MPDWSQLHPFKADIGESSIRQLTDNGRLIVHRRDGMFARLLCFANAIRLSKKLGLKDPILIWNRVAAGDNKTHGYAESIRGTIALPDFVEMDTNADIQGAGPLFSINRPCVLKGENTEEAIDGLAAIVRSETYADNPYVIADLNRWK